MARRNRSWTRVLPVVFAALILTTLSGCSLYGGPQAVVPPKGDQMQTIWNLFVPIFWMSVIVFVIVQGLLIVAIIRFRRRPGGPPARQIHGNTKLELTWTIIPALVLAGIAVPTLTTIAKFAETPSNAITVRVVGHQWWWEFQYPEYGVVTADEAHIPVGVPINWELESADVIHSFWVPQLAGKTDVVPGNHNHMSYTAKEAGTYLGQCAEFCGIQHANMRFEVVAESMTDFNAWIANQKTPAMKPAEENANAVQGRDVFLNAGCAGCHTINGVSIGGKIGPDLTHFGERNCIAGCVLPNTKADLATWLHNPQAVKEGTIMPNLHLSDEQVSDLVAYLEGLQ
ncbi:MAG TPA: cytochrome c oxidase subunit II [Thermomicrobiaceae bacterium]|nr:cytochrome c oxidase subunit II [Thermomicrobiaceae bacterium]